MIGITRIFDTDGNKIAVITQDGMPQIDCIELDTDIFALVALSPIDDDITEVILSVYFDRQDAFDDMAAIGEGYNSLPPSFVSAIDYLHAAGKYDDTPSRVRSYLRNNDISAVEYLNELYAKE